MGWVDPWVGLGWVSRNGPMDNSDVSNRTTSRDTSRKTFHVPAATDDHARPEQEEFFSLRVAETVEPIEMTLRMRSGTLSRDTTSSTDCSARY